MFEETASQLLVAPSPVQQSSPVREGSLVNDVPNVAQATSQDVQVAPKDVQAASQENKTAPAYSVMDLVWQVGRILHILLIEPLYADNELEPDIAPSTKRDWEFIWCVIL